MTHPLTPTYRPHEVERLAQNYLHIRSTLLGSSRPSAQRFYITPPADPASRSERPFGDNGTSPWPFREPRRASPVIDGKARAQAALELHVVTLDFELALKRMPDRDLELLYKYYVFGTHTLDDLCLERGITSRGSMSDVLMRMIRRLTRLMNNEQS